MFFNKYKKIGKEVGIISKKFILLPFNEEKKLPPLGFFRDIYVYAFSASFLHNNLAVMGSLDWKGEDTSKAMTVASNYIDSSKEFSEFQFECFSNGIEKLNENESFIKGKYHADLVVRSLYGIELTNIPVEIKDPIISQAKKTKDDFFNNEQYIDLQFPLNKHGDSRIAIAILHHTIWKYIQNKYM